MTLSKTCTDCGDDITEQYARPPAKDAKLVRRKGRQYMEPLEVLDRKCWLIAYKARFGKMPAGLREGD